MVEINLALNCRRRNYNNIPDIAANCNNVVTFYKGFSSDQMFDVVSEVQHYHKFVPWCKKSKVNFADEESLDADLVIGFPPLFGESYKVTLKEEKFVILLLHAL